MSVQIHDHAFIDRLLQMPPEEAAVHTAVHVVRRTAASFPALVAKAWWSDELSRAQTASVSKYFAKFVTPYVMSTNMELIREAVASQKWVNDDADVDDIRGKAVFDVKAGAVGRTITCIYNVEEDGVSIEMLIRFPVDFPLKIVQVQCSKHAGIKQSKWNRWMLQMVTLFSVKDGKATDLIDLWKQSVEQELAGVEPCPICYSVVHIEEHTLPRKRCKTCRNHFHTQCLAKWFRTSHNNGALCASSPLTKLYVCFFTS